MDRFLRAPEIQGEMEACPWKHAMDGLKKRTRRRHVEQGCGVSRTYPNSDDPVEAPTSGSTTID